MTNDWFKKNWFEFIKLGILILGIVWGVGQTIDNHSNAILHLQKQQQVDIKEHKEFVKTLHQINSSQQLMQYQLEQMSKNIDKIEKRGFRYGP